MRGQETSGLAHGLAAGRKLSLTRQQRQGNGGSIDSFREGRTWCIGITTWSDAMAAERVSSHQVPCKVCLRNNSYIVGAVSSLPGRRALKTPNWLAATRTASLPGSSHRLHSRSSNDRPSKSKGHVAS